MEPTAVTSQEIMDNPPACASFAGSMTMPDPIMFTAVMIINCVTLIFLVVLIVYPQESYGDSDPNQDIYPVLLWTLEQLNVVKIKLLTEARKCYIHI